MNVSLPTRIPQNDDSVAMLLARLVGVPVRGTLLASATRTTNTSTTTLDFFGCRAVVLFLNITASSAGGLRLNIEYQDPVSGVWRASIIAPSPYITSTGLYPILVGQAIGTMNNGSLNAGAICSLPLAANMRITVQHGDANNQTYSLAYETL